MITPQEALLRCIEHREIFHDEMLHLFRQIMSGQMSPTMVAALTVGLRVKKETIGEITAAVGAGILTEDAAMRFVAARARYMAEAAGQASTGMSAVLGGDEAALLERLAELGLEPAKRPACRAPSSGPYRSVQSAASPPRPARPASW